PPPVIMMAISVGVNPNFRSANNENSDSNDERPNDVMNMIINDMKKTGMKILRHPFWAPSTWTWISSSYRSGSCMNKMETTKAISANPAAKKNGIRVPMPAKNPPTPGPIMNPVEMAADI